MVLFGAVAILDAGLAGRNRWSCHLLPNRNAGLLAHDIIFFWVAAMMMAGIEFMGEVPFKDVYIHALVLDEHGQENVQIQGQCDGPAGAG